MSEVPPQYDPDEPPPPDPEPANRWIIGGILIAMCVWAVFMAVGDYLANHNPLRPLVILACVGLFGGFWALMLRLARSRRNGGDS